MNWLLYRLKEPSTYKGLFALLTVFGLSIKPELAEQIIAVGVALISIVEIVRREKPDVADPDSLPPIELQGLSTGRTSPDVGRTDDGVHGLDTNPHGPMARAVVPQRMRSLPPVGQSESGWNG